MERSTGERPAHTATFRIALALCSLFVAIVLISQRNSWATEVLCDPGVMSVGGELGYHLRGTEDGNDLRCEGLYRAPTSGGLELLSFVHHTNTGAAATPGRIEFRLPALPDKKGTVAHIRARTLREKLYYRLDARAKLGSTFGWSSAEVLAQIHLTGQDLGIVATITEKDEPVFIPVIAPIAADSNEKTKTVFVIRSQLRIESVQWRLYAPGSNKLTVPWTKLPGRNYPPGWPVEITLPRDLAGLFVVDIYATPKNRDTPERLSALIRL